MPSSEESRPEEPQGSVAAFPWREKTNLPKRILVTGAAGAVGRAVTSALVQRGHFVRGFDLNESEEASEAVVGNLTSAAEVDAATEGMDTIVHLGATPDEADFLTKLLPNNIVGSYHVLDAAKRFGVRRVIGASTLQTVRGFGYTDKLITLEDGFAPINHYSSTKIFLEALGRSYVHLCGLSFIGVRLGWFPRSPENSLWGVRKLEGRLVYLSHDDCKRFFLLAVEVEDVSYALVFLTSLANPEGFGLDPEPARRLGFVARDKFPEGLPWAVPELAPA